MPHEHRPIDAELVEPPRQLACDESGVPLVEVVQGVEDRLAGADDGVERHIVVGIHVTPRQPGIPVAGGEPQALAAAFRQGQSHPTHPREVGRCERVVSPHGEITVRVRGCSRCPVRDTEPRPGRHAAAPCRPAGVELSLCRGIAARVRPWLPWIRRGLAERGARGDERGSACGPAGGVGVAPSWGPTWAALLVT
jgi:hypothetical protein